MGRVFIAPIDSASALTQRDLIEVIANTGWPIEIREVLITTNLAQDVNEATTELKMSRYTGTYTTGSGGATATAEALGAAATSGSTTTKVGSTTRVVVGTGAEEILGYAWLNNRLGFHYLPPTKEDRPLIEGDDAFVITMQAAFAAATAVGGYVVYEELIG